MTRLTASRYDTRWTLAALSLSIVLASLGTSLPNVGLPALADAFDATFAQVQWVVLSYLLSITALIVGVGRLGDIVGRRRLLLVGVALFTLSSALSGVSPSLPALVACRAVQGVGAAMMMALTIALVGDSIPRAQNGRAMGLLGTMSAIGTALGPSLGGVLIATFGWRAMFLVNVPLGVVVLYATWRHLEPDRLRASNRVAFDRTQLTPHLFGKLAANLLVMTVMMGTLVVGPFYLTGALGLDIASAGLIMSIGPIVAAIAGVPSGRAVDRFGARQATILGLVAVAAGSLGLALLPGWLGVAGYAAPMGTMTAGFALFQAANNTAVMRDVDPTQRGVIAGLLTFSRNLGLIAGASAMGSIFARATELAELKVPRAHAVATGMRTTFAVAAMLTVVAIVIAAFSRARASRQVPTT